MPVTLQQFAKHLKASGLLSIEQVQSWLNGLDKEQRPSDGEALGQWLVAQKHLTSYQAEAVLAGETKHLVLGNYVVRDRIGAGGMGQVFKARHRRMKRVVALKVLPEDVSHDEALIARFEREVEAAAKLMHPNIVTAFDADESNGIVYLVMEYVPGEDLSSLVKSNGRLSIPQSVACILDAARGLEFAHANGVIHRDIKPANLLLSAVSDSSAGESSAAGSAQKTTSQDRRTVKILDMGLARINDTSADVATQAELTGTGIIMGTVDYMAPEQALSTKNADHRSDIYSLGVTLHYLLMGRPTFEGDSLMSRLLAHREAEIPLLRNERPEVPLALDELFTRMLAKNPEDRVQSMTEVVQELEAIQSGTAPQPPADGASLGVPKTDEDANLNDFLDSLQDTGSSKAMRVATRPTRIAADPDAAERDVKIAETMIGEAEETAATVIAGPLASSTKASASIHRFRRPKWLRTLVMSVGLLTLVVIGGTIRNSQKHNSGQKQRAIAQPKQEPTNDPAVASSTPVLKVSPDRSKRTALSFGERGSYVEGPVLPMDLSQPFTFEAWCGPFQLSDERRSHRVVAKLGPSDLNMYADSAWQINAYEMTQDGVNVGVVATDENHESTVNQTRTHLAGQWDGETLTVFVNGQPSTLELIAFNSSENPKALARRLLNSNEPAKLWIGEAPAELNRAELRHFGGQIDTVRISRGLQYDGPFTPTELTANGDTVALYDFHEGSGDTLHDISGHGHDGKIVGAEWVSSSDATTVD